VTQKGFRQKGGRLRETHRKQGSRSACEVAVKSRSTWKEKEKSTQRDETFVAVRGGRRGELSWVDLTVVGDGGK